MSHAEIHVLRADIASLLAELRELREERRGDRVAFSEAFVELQNNVKRVIDRAVLRIDRLPCMAAKKGRTK